LAGEAPGANTANTASTRAGREKSRVQAPQTNNPTPSEIPLFACLRVRSRWYVARLAAKATKALTRTQSNPTQIFAEDVTEEKGENARLSAFVGAIAVGDLVKSTLGPKGMDKILQSA
jgi:cytoskeletal protein RodZ